MLDIRDWIKKRARHSLHDFGEDDKIIIRGHIDQILDRHPKTKRIWIGGSRVSGSWRDEGTEFTAAWNDYAYRAGLRKAGKLSDWDYLTEPMQTGKITREIDLVSVNRFRNILIYDEKILI